MAIIYSIIIPCYNEAENIPLLLNRFQEIVRGSVIEVILVDNGSTDGTDNVLKQRLPNCHFARSIRVDVNQGYGYGILQGLKVAKGKYIGWMHADMQTDPEDAIKAFWFAKKYGGDDVYIKGRRRGRPFIDAVFTTGMSLFESLIFRTCMYDINAQPNVFPRKFFDKWVDPPWDFSLDLYVYYLARKMRIRMIRFPVRFPERIYGSSKWNTDGFRSKWKFIKRTVKYSIQLKRIYG